jgi:hypothetical protein
MVLSRGLVISLGVSALGCTLLFLYFRNKISAVERKVDVMFDLIQNHQQNTMENRQYNEVIHEEQQQQQQEQQQQGAWTEESRQERNLIDVSDEDTDDDSDEVSDSESEDEDVENHPKISLAGVENISLELADVKKITVKESDKVLVNDNIELEEVEDSLDEIEDDDDDDEDEEDEGEVNEPTKTFTVVKEELDEEFDYTKLKVSELKAIAEQKGLEGYKSLKKTPLIELLKASE